MVDAVPDPGTLAVPGPEEIQVWWARIEPGSFDDETRARLAADVDPATLTRTQRYVRPADRDRALAGHALLRRVLAAAAGGRPAELKLGTRCGHCESTEHGKPFLMADGDPPVEVNLSHSGPIVCVALAGPGAGVGIDVEARRGIEWSTLRSSVFADSEWAAAEVTADPARSRTDAWARKEAAVKSCGWGLSMPLAEVVITADDGSWAHGWSAVLTGRVGTAHGHDVDMGDDVAASVAVHRPAAPLPMREPVVHRISRL